MKTLRPLAFVLHPLAFCILCSSLALAATGAQNAPKIDADFPGGNIIVLGIDGDTVRVKRDLRDTKGNWFYWSFRVRGAQGRTLQFQFAEKNWVGYRGPAVSTDGATTWRWLNDTPSKALGNSFKYSFGPEENEVFFGWSMNYTERDLNRFLEKHKKHPALNIRTLCKTDKGRDVELLRITGAKQKPAFKVLLTARHHACEMTASYALEGMIETVLSDTTDGNWLREHADFFIVPFVDKDGVEAGDQGKNRKPHDHNRDYVEGIHPTVRAIKKQVPEWLEGRPVVAFDLHCPSHKGQKVYFFVHSKKGPDGKPQKDDGPIGKNTARYSAILEAGRKSPVPYKASSNRPSVGHPGMCGSWAATLPNILFTATLELPYSTADDAVITAESARLFGKDMARALRAFLESGQKE